MGPVTYDLLPFHLSRPTDSPVSLKALPSVKEFIHNPPLFRINLLSFPLLYLIIIPSKNKRLQHIFI